MTAVLGTTAVAGNGRPVDRRVEELLENRRGIILDIGCGNSKQPGSVGMDHQPLPGVDVVWDWSEFPWPFPDESVLTIIASHVVEHVPPIWPRSRIVQSDDGSLAIATESELHFVRWMSECWRILKPDRQMAMVTPYGSSELYIRDPSHCNPCNEQTAWYFDPEHASGWYGFYEPAPWQIEMNTFNQNGVLEWVWRKREDRAEYHVDERIHYPGRA